MWRLMLRCTQLLCRSSTCGVRRCPVSIIISPISCCADKAVQCSRDIVLLLVLLLTVHEAAACKRIISAPNLQDLVDLQKVSLLAGQQRKNLATHEAPGWCRRTDGASVHALRVVVAVAVLQLCAVAQRNKTSCN